MLGNPLASTHERLCQQLIEIVIWEVNVRAAKWRWWLEFVPALFRDFGAAHPDSDSDSDSDSEAAVRRRSAPQDWGGAMSRCLRVPTTPEKEWDKEWETTCSRAFTGKYELARGRR